MKHKDRIIWLDVSYVGSVGDVNPWDNLAEDQVKKGYVLPKKPRKISTLKYSWLFFKELKL